MRYFCSDIHFGDKRLNLFQRDIQFKTRDEFDINMIRNWNNVVSDEDIVYVIGDVVHDIEKVDILSQLKGYKILIIGNYDEKHTDILKNYFDEIYENLIINIEGIGNVYMNHYPEKAHPDFFNIVGHVHALWKVQRNMINVSVDAWNFQLVPEESIKFLYNAIKNYFDINVFAGELNVNKKTI